MITTAKLLMHHNTMKTGKLLSIEEVEEVACRRHFDAVVVGLGGRDGIIGVEWLASEWDPCVYFRCVVVLIDGVCCVCCQEAQLKDGFCW